MNLPSLKKCYISIYARESANLHNSYNSIGYTDSYLKSLVQHIRRLYTHILRMCEIMQPAAESLVYYDKLRDDDYLSVIAGGLR